MAPLQAVTEGADRANLAFAETPPSTTGCAGGPPPPLKRGRNFGRYAASKRLPASSQFTTSHHAFR